MKKVAVINAQFSIDSELEVAFVEFLKLQKMDEKIEREFLNRHNLSVSQFITLQKTFGQLIFDIEGAQIPAEIPRNTTEN